MQNILVQQKIKSLEEEIKGLKALLKESSGKKSKKKMNKKSRPLSIYGLLKGVTATKQDFKEAEKSLFP